MTELPPINVCLFPKDFLFLPVSLPLEGALIQAIILAYINIFCSLGFSILSKNHFTEKVQLERLNTFLRPWKFIQDMSS